MTPLRRDTSQLPGLSGQGEKPLKANQGRPVASPER